MGMKVKVLRLLKRNLYVYKSCVWLYSFSNRLSQKYKFIRIFYNAILGLRDIKLSRLDGIRRYCDKSNILRTILENKKNRIVYHAPYFEGTKGYDEIIETPDIYYCTLNDVEIIGGRDGILAEGNVYLNDKFSLPNAESIDFTMTDGVLCKNDGVSIISVSKHSTILEEGIFLVGVASNNFYHFVNDVCSRVAFFGRIDLRGGVLLVDSTVQLHGTYLGFLSAINVYGLPIRFVSNNERILVKKLHYFSPCTFGNVYSKRGATRETGLCYSKCHTVLEFFRACILDKANTTQCNIYPKRIFITRGADKFKRLINEAQCAELSKRYGFTLVDLGQFDIFEQALIVNNADIVIGDEGAAFVNIMYGAQKTLLVSIMPRIWNNCQFTTIANEVGVRCINLDAKLLDPEKRTHEIDLDYFERFLLSLD